MKIANSNQLFDHVHSSTFDEQGAAAFAKKTGANVTPGDELRLYLDKSGAPAQAIISRSKAECAVAFNAQTGFLWGALIELGERAVLVGDGDPHVIIDLRDLSFTCERAS